MMDSFFDIPGLDPTDAFSSAFADDLLGGDVFGLNGGIGGSILGLDMDMMDPFGSGPGSSSSSLLSDVFNSPTSTSGSDYGSSMSSFSAATMEDTLCEADLFQSFASAKNFAARNKVRLNNAMKARNGGGGAVRNTHNNSHHTHNNNTYKKYGKHGGSRPTISMGGNNNGGGGGSSVHPKVYISTFSHNKRNGAGGGGSSSGAGSGTSILLKSKRGNGGSGGSRNGRGGGGSSLISSKMSTTITSHHHQPRRSGMYGHVQQQQLQQQQQYQQRQPKQIPKTIKFNRSAGSGSGSSYQLPGSSSISKGNVFPQKSGSCKSKNSSSHSSINNNGRNNNSSSAANRSSFQVAAAAAAQVQQSKVVPIPNPSADHDYCVVYTEAMFATSSTAASSNNSSDHLNSNLDDLLISSSSSSQSNSCPNVDSFLNDHLFSLGSPSAMMNDTIVNSIDGSGGSGDTHMKKGQQSSTEVANDLEDLLDGFIPDDVLLNELPNCLQDLFDLDLNSLMDVKSEDVLDGLNDVCNLMTDNYMDDLEELYCSTFDTSSFPTPAPTPASSPAPPPLMMTHLQTPNACTSTSSSSSGNSIANNSLPKLMSEEGVEGKEEQEEEEACDDESTLLVIPKDHDEHDANSWQDIAPHTPPTTASCLQY